MSGSARNSEYPKFFRVRQQFMRPRVEDIEQAVFRELEAVNVQDRLRPGDSVAITAGSRGIANIPVILRSIVRFVRECGAEPFLVPAMGSHGGGTAAGQMRVLEKLGITESSCECPIRGSMETVVVADVDGKFPVHFDRYASRADHVIVCGRVKPHTGFIGPIESGLMKMMLIGLGKHTGAAIYHRAIFDYDFDEIVRKVGRLVIERCRVLCGVAVVENAYDETGHIETVLPCDFESREPELLRMAREWMPKLPFATGHLLLIDRMGKDISGTGFDTNVVDRKQNETGGRGASLCYLAVRGLTPATAGNATGIGLAEFCRSRLLREMDVEQTRTNVITAAHVTGARLPLDYETDREILDVVLSVIGLTPPPLARVQWIQDTLHLSEVECSAAYWDEAHNREDLDVITPLRALPLDSTGNLPDDWFTAADPALGSQD